MPYNADGAWITQDGVGMPLSSGGIQSLTASQIATPQQLQAYLQSNPGANANDLASLGYQPIDGSSPGATLPILQKWNPGGQVVSIAGKQYYKVNPAGGWHDTELSGTGSGFGDFFKSPVGLGLLAAGGAGAFGLLGDAAGAGLGDLAGAGDFIGGTGGMSTVSQAFNPVTGLFESVGGPMSTTAELTSAAAGGGFTGGATGSLLSNLANVPTSIPGEGTQSPAPVQEGPTNPSTGPGGSMPPLPGLTLPPGASSLGSLLQSLLGGSGSGGGAGGTSGLDLTKLLGTLGAGGLSAVGYDKARDTLHSIYDQITNARAPSLNAYNNAVQNPDTWYQSAPAMGAASAAAQALSTKGNPAENPGLTAQLAANQLGGYDKYLNTMSGPAFGGQQYQASIGGNLATLAQGLPNSLAQGLGSLTGINPTQNLADAINNYLKGPNSTGSAGGTSTGSPDFTNSFNNTDPFAFNSTPAPTFTDTSQEDLLKQAQQNPNWFGSPINFGNSFSLS